MTSHHPPVEDWSTDFDHTDPDAAQDIYRQLAARRGQCPVLHSSRHGGFWAFSQFAEKYQDERARRRGLVEDEFKAIAATERPAHVPG